MSTGFPTLTSQPPSRVVTRESEYSAETTPSRDAAEPSGNEDSPLNTQQRSRGLTASHRKLVFTDPVAFRYLEEDQSTIVIDRRRALAGYEIYVVEQWACSRIDPTFILCTYTGDQSHSILVNVLAIPTDPSVWSRRLKIYFDAVSHAYHREMETPFGTILVTNLSGFPSSLNVISIPDGDVRKHREDFIVNEDLKRMGCSGRAAFSLGFPQASTINKFHHLYHTSERVPLYSSVMELVRFSQTALALFGKLQPHYVDGLLCDLTEKAITEWWNEIGTDFHNVEPSDGILGPTTVSALIGLTIGAYNRLKETGAPVGKDPMDLSSMKRAVGHFQRSVRMEKTRRLDRATLDRLHRATAKSAADEGFGVTRAIKSTVGGLGGKGGEMIARGFGGGREKVGIAEVETLDIDRLSQLVSGPSLKWLWQGKELKSASTVVGAATDELNGRVFSTDDAGNFIWTSKESSTAGGTSLGGTEEVGDPRRLQNGYFRSHAGRFAAIDEAGSFASSSFLEVPQPDGRPADQNRKRSSAQSTISHAASDMSLHDQNLSVEVLDETTKRDSDAKEPLPKLDLRAHREALRGIDKHRRDSPTHIHEQLELQNVRHKLGANIYRDFSAKLNMNAPKAKALQRSQSVVQLRDVSVGVKQQRLPRHLSFSVVAEPIFRRHFIEAVAPQAADKTPTKPLAVKRAREYDILVAQRLATRIMSVERGLAPFAASKVEVVERLAGSASERLEELNGQYYEGLEEYQTLHATSTDLVGREQTALSEGMRRIDMLGQKLDYELGELHSRIQEVEEGISEFERSVVEVETSVKALVHEDNPRPVSWFQRTLNLWAAPKSVVSAAAPKSTDKAVQ